jgi:hypothetical protein
MPLQGMPNIYGNSIQKWDTGFSDGFWILNHMADAAYATGPAHLGAQRYTLFEYFAPHFSAGPNKHNAVNSRFLGYNLYCNILLYIYIGY